MNTTAKKTRIDEGAAVRSKNYFSLYKLRNFAWSIVRGVLVIGISFVILYPLLVKLSLTFMAEKDLYDTTVQYVPRNFTLDNIKMVWRFLEYPKAFGNSFLLSMMVSSLQLISCTIIAYGFARFKFPLKSLWFGLVILTLVIPPQTIMIPLFLHFRYFDILGVFEKISGNPINLLDSYWPFILMSLTGVGMKNGLYIYIIRQFFRGMPKELEEAAYVDGSNTFRTFLTIMLPSAVPIMITSFLFSFVWQWNDTFYSTLFLNRLVVLPATLSALAQNVNQYFFWQTGQAGNTPPVYISMLNNTGSLMVVLPLIIIYAFAQRYFVESIERSGIVG